VQPLSHPTGILRPAPGRLGRALGRLRRAVEILGWAFGEHRGQHLLPGLRQRVHRQVAQQTASLPQVCGHCGHLPTYILEHLFEVYLMKVTPARGLCIAETVTATAPTAPNLHLPR
jgi:hypothetical protein